MFIQNMYASQTLYIQIYMYLVSDTETAHLQGDVMTLCIKTLWI